MTGRENRHFPNSRSRTLYYEPAHGEQQKRDSWREAIRRRRDLSAGGVEFVPFSIEAGGVWGPAARRFFKDCIALANDDRDIDLYHWSSPRCLAVNSQR